VKVNCSRLRIKEHDRDLVGYSVDAAIIMVVVHWSVNSFEPCPE